MITLKNEYHGTQHKTETTNQPMEPTTIAEHWDPAGIIQASADPAEEFALWQQYATKPENEWSGYEFALSDFETYIASR